MSLLSTGCLVLTGCDEKERKDARTLLGGIAGSLSQSPLFQNDIPFHKRFKWNAEDFFDDPKVIALCRAIEAKDLREIDRLIANGSDANALGKDNMTPLLWAFPTQDLAVFTKILKAGADPNVQITSDFGVNLGNDSRIQSGMSVMELAAITFMQGYFEAVMKHGGDPNLVSKVPGEPDTPLHSIAKHRYWSDNDGRIIEHAKLLLDAGANINAVSQHGTPITVAVTRERANLAVFLLEAGADWEIVPEPLEFVAEEGFHYRRIPPTLLHEVLRIKDKERPDVKIEVYDKLILLLEAKGVDFDKVREEREQYHQRWR